MLYCWQSTAAPARPPEKASSSEPEPRAPFIQADRVSDPPAREPAQERGSKPPALDPPPTKPDKSEVFQLVGRSKEPVGPVKIREAFDKTDRGLPKGWSGWSNQRNNVFGVTDRKALSLPHGLAITGNSGLSAQAWPARALPGDVQAGAAVFLNSLIPAQVFVRGAALKSPKPTYYAASVSRGMQVQLLRSVRGVTTVLATVKSAGYLSEKWVRVAIQAQGKRLQVQAFRPDTSQYLDDQGQWVGESAWAIRRDDQAITAGGFTGVARPAQYNGTLFFDDFTASPPTQESGATPRRGAAAPLAKIHPLLRPVIPRHYPHIRIAMLAYYGNPMSDFEDGLLKESVDLVIPNPAYLKHINEVAPKTPQLIYTNTSNLYLELLMSWLMFADAQGLPRELAFYHAARPVAFRGNSPSSRPVTWFWGVYRGNDDLINLTSAAHGGKQIALPGVGQSLYLGYPERFREINIDLASAADNGWSAVVEYASEIDGAGAPTRWKPLDLETNSTASLRKSGQVTFDPPADWKTASLQNTIRLFYVRLRTKDGGDPPVAKAILGRDYVAARGGASGAVPAFDFKADANGDGYLDDREYARRATGKNARFAYESRMLTESYGQMRFAAHPSSVGFRAWAVEYHRQILKHTPLAAGLFMDNSDGKAPVNAADVLEPVGTYAQDYGLMLNEISHAVAPCWVLANTAEHPRADPVVQCNPAYMEEFAIRPLAHHYIYFEDLAASIARRAKLASPAPIAVIDSHPQGGVLTDPRMQMATLAYYYLVSDPESTFLMLYGGFEPASTWKRHWLPAVAHDIGKPRGTWSQWKTGTDPANAHLSYRIYRRDFEKAVVLYKPLSYARGVSEKSTLGNETSTLHDLGGSYRLLAADGSLGEPLTKVSLRNGEGAILVRS
jgi:hypothetical protein